MPVSYTHLDVYKRQDKYLVLVRLLLVALVTLIMDWSLPVRQVVLVGWGVVLATVVLL